MIEYTAPAAQEAPALVPPAPLILVKAAAKAPDGQIFKAKYHTDAINQGRAAGFIWDWRSEAKDTLVEGYITSTGDFISKGQVYEMETSRQPIDDRRWEN